MKDLLTQFTNGVTGENPTFGLVLGLCPTLAVTATLMSGFWMGVAVVFVLAASNTIISAARRLIPGNVRIPAYIVIIATFVTAVDLLMSAYLPDMHRLLGIFIPLIVVNCIIMARAEAFAAKNRIGLALADGLGMGTGFTLALVLLGAIRELLGTGDVVVGRALFGRPLFDPATVMILPPGAFIALGLLLGAKNLVISRCESRRGAGET